MAAKRDKKLFQKASKKRYWRKSKNNTTKVQRPINNLNKTIYTYRQFVYTVQIQTAVTEKLAAYAMIASQVSQFATFAALYDMYRVNYLEFQFRPIYLPTNLNNAATTTTEPYESPVIYTAIDKNDNVAPSTVANLREYQTCDVHNDRVTFTRRFKPGVNTGVYNGSVVTGAGSTISPWINCSTNNIVHYGLKAGIPDYPTNTEFQKWNIDVFCSLSFKFVQ